MSSRIPKPGSMGGRNKLQFTSVISFLQEEWRGHEAAKNQWARERKILIAKQAELEQQAASAKDLVQMLERRTRMLEETLRRERELHWGNQPPPTHTWADEEITAALERVSDGRAHTPPGPSRHGSFEEAVPGPAASTSSSSEGGSGPRAAGIVHKGRGRRGESMIEPIPRNRGRRSRSPSPTRRGNGGLPERGRKNVGGSEGSKFKPSGRSLSPPLASLAALPNPWEDFDMSDAMQEAAVMAAVDSVLERDFDGPYDEDDEDRLNTARPEEEALWSEGSSAGAGADGDGSHGGLNGKRRPQLEAIPNGKDAAGGEFAGFPVVGAGGHGEPSTPEPIHGAGGPWGNGGGSGGGPGPANGGSSSNSPSTPPRSPRSSEGAGASGASPLFQSPDRPGYGVQPEVGYDDDARRREELEQVLKQRLRSHLDGVQSVAFDAGGMGAPRMLSTSEDGTVKLWALQSMQAAKEDQEPLATFRGHRGAVYTCALNLAGGRAFSAGVDGTIRVWGIPPPGSGLYSRHGVAAPCKAGALEGHTDVVWQIALQHGAPHRLASASADRTIRVWDTTSESPLLVTLRVPDSPFPPPPPGVAADGTPMPPDPSAVAEVSRPTCVAFGPDGGHLLAGCTDGALYRYDIEAGTCDLLTPRVMEPMDPRPPLCNQVAVHPTLPLVMAAGDDGLVRSYDVGRPGEKPVESFIACAEGASAIAIDPSGVQLATGGHSGWVKLWDIRAARTCLLELPAHDPKMGEGVHSLTYAPEGATSGGRPMLASGGADGAVCLWVR